MTYHLSWTYLSLSRHWKSRVSNHQCSNYRTFEKTSSMWEHVYNTKKWIPLLRLCTQSNLSQSMPYSDVRQQYTCFKSKLFWCHKCSSKSIFNIKSDTWPLLLVCKKLWTPSSLSLNLATYILPQMCYRRLAHATKAAILRVENTTSELDQSLVLMFLRQRRHIWLQKILQNYTSRIMEPRLHNAQESSWQS